MANSFQEHPCGGDFLTIWRNGRHQYWLDGEEDSKVWSVSQIIEPLGPPFGAGVGWSKNLMKEGKDPIAEGKSAQNEGNYIHQLIDTFISFDGQISEEHKAFNSWYTKFSAHEWIASESFLFNKGLGYGGTLDAVSLDPTTSSLILHDWKTVDRESMEKGLERTKKFEREKDVAQLGGYLLAMSDMQSDFRPDKIHLTYIYRDGSGITTIPLSAEYCTDMFKACHYLWKTRGKYNAKT
jgi:hypothetical protein